MESFGVVGLDWRRGGSSALARLTLPPEERARRLPELAAEIGVDELVYLATCNRVEVFVAGRDDVPLEEVRRRLHRVLGGEGEARRVLRAWQGEGAVEHLFLVACGLDSARLGETEILGQVREAFELARDLGLARERLGLLFEEALRVAKRARAATSISEGRTSLAEIGLERVRAALAGDDAAVALVGITAMTERCARALAEDGRRLWIVNRSLGPARRLARGLGASARALALEDFRREPPAVGALITATGAPDSLFGPPELERLRAARGADRPLLCVDFATVPDVDPAAAAELGCERLGMDEVIAIAEENREHQLRKSGEARDLVDGAILRLGGKLARRRAERSIAALHESYVATARRQVELLLEKHFGDLDGERAELLRRFASRLAKHFAHLPTSGLRELAQEHGPQAVTRFFQHAEGELNRRLEEHLDEARVFADLAEPRLEPEGGASS